MKWIEGYEGLYKISEDGKVWSCRGLKFLKPNNNGGYQQVRLYSASGSKCHYLHRLVAQAYIINPENKHQVNHTDGNKLNNHFSNLEWSTDSENKLHALKTGLHTHPSRKILQYTLDGKFIREYDSHSEVVKLLGLKPWALNNALSGYANTAHGFIWKYKE